MGAIGEDELAKWETMAGVGDEERILVSVRVRPLNAIEISRNDPVDWECINNTSIIHRNGLSDRSLPPSAYSFDRVFGQECTTRQVYENAAKGVVLSVVNGINSSIFAYGQTSSGKTYTMTGITEYSVSDIYDYIEKHEEREFVMKFSAIEIYNEAVRDLLSSDPTPLRLLDDPERGTIVEKLTEETLRDREHLQDLLSVCEAQRQIGETSLNEMSSRSHQILRLTIESTARQFSGGENFSSLAASVNFVDLAGSERASQALSAGTRLKEGCHINRSLLTLGTVIRKLSKGRNGHIPYRDSKLTRILQSSLGGNARTAIICTMSPARSHIEQSRNTLLFATCAKEVATSAQVNVVMSDKALVRHLQKELARLESELRSPNSAPKSSHHSEAIKERDARITKMEKEIKELIEQRDLVQSRLDEMLLATREWDQVSQHSSSNAQNTYEDVISSSETSGVGHQSQDFSVISFESSTGSQNCKEIQFEQSETQEVEDVNLVPSKYSVGLVHDDYRKTSEKSRDGYGDFDELCKEVQCIEMEDNKRINLLLTDETEFLVPLNTVDFTEIEQQQGVQVQYKDQGQYLIEKINESSTFEELKNLKTTEEDVPPVKSTNVVLSRSMSCRARLMNNSCSNSPTFIDKIEPSPYVEERRQNELDFNIEHEKCPELKSNSNEIPKTVSEDDITSISKFVDGLKEMAQIHCQEKERTISEDIAERKTVKDVCLQAVISPCESPSRWPIEFEKKQQEIIELWHACNISLIHRTYFFLLFKGDPADSIYLEVEQRRLSFLNNNNNNNNTTSTENKQKITLASSLKNLGREREMLIRQMQKRMTTMEREELYSKWGISLESKRRRMQLAKKLWSETKNIEHVKESAAIVAKLIGLLEPEHALKEMFGFSFAPQLTHRRSFSWKNGK